ncbi:MAG TPA: leucine-rich repeat domain-containing protein [Candidatus Limiplasma sp.]|nr:leucine-rich repeat domain-containing protein [Candidatus Limiplasma sp.]
MSKGKNQAQIDTLIEIANTLEHKELALEREEKQLLKLHAELDERERKLGKKADADGAPLPDEAADISAEVAGVLKSVFWDYANNVHQISTQMSTVTAAMMCAAVTCVLEHRGFNAREVFLQEMQKLLDGGTLGAACQSPLQAAGAIPHPVKQAADKDDTDAGDADGEAKAEPDTDADEPVLPGVSADGVLHIQSVAAFQKLGEYGLRNDDTVVRVALPEGVVQLPGSFFYGCRKLEEVWLPNSCTEIGPYAFYGCEKLHTVHLDENSALREIGEYAFAMCGALKTFTVPAQVETLGTSVFRFCSQLKKVTFPKGSNRLHTIGSHLLQNCTALEKARLPRSITTIPTSMFYGCSNLKKVVAKGVDTIEDYAFYGNESLRTVRIGERGSIAPQAFEGCDPGMEIEYVQSADND